jgi:hypothetical protein
LHASPTSDTGAGVAASLGDAPLGAALLDGPLLDDALLEALLSGALLFGAAAGEANASCTIERILS